MMKNRLRLENASEKAAAGFFAIHGENAEPPEGYRCAKQAVILVSSRTEA
jgi:hypothetical protein